MTALAVYDDPQPWADEAVAMIESQWRTARNEPLVFSRDLWLVDNVLRPCFMRRPDGLPMFRGVWVEMPKGYAKTFLMGAILAAEALAFPGTHAFIVASDKEQAALILESLTLQCDLNPTLRAAFRKAGDRFTCANGSFLRVMSADEPSFHGIGGTAQRVRLGLDEISHWPDYGEKLYNACLATASKIPDGAVYCFGNAGVINSWQYERRERFIKAPSNWFFHAEPGQASWFSDEQLAQAEADLDPVSFARYYLNIWGDAATAFIPIEQWDACFDPAIPPLTPKTQLVVGVDIGVQDDASAIVAVSRDPRRTDNKAAIVREVKVWQPSPGHPVSLLMVASWLVEFCASHKVEMVAYDPSQAYLFIELFQQLNQTTWCKPFIQGQPRVIADTYLLQSIRARHIVHDGNVTLRSHMMNAGFKVPTGSESGGRIVKANGNGGKIDSVIALSMAAKECERLMLGSGTVGTLHFDDGNAYSYEFRRAMADGRYPGLAW